MRRARRRRSVLLGLVLVTIVALVGAFLVFVEPGLNDASADGPTKGPLLLNENFTGNSLDTQHWSPCYHWTSSGCTNAGNNELEWYVPEQVKVADGTLSLEAKPQTVTGLDDKQFDYVSGMISGLAPEGPRFAFKYGYVESRIRIPKGQGLWPALWMLPTTGESLPEVDVIETVGEQPNVAQMHTHWDDNGARKNRGLKWHTSDLTRGWHTVGLEWKPASLTWYVDGVARWRVTNPQEIPQESMYLIANLAVGGAFTKTPNRSTPFPSSLKIDYIRVWGAA